MLVVEAVRRHDHWLGRIELELRGGRGARRCWSVVGRPCYADPTLNPDVNGAVPTGRGVVGSPLERRRVFAEVHERVFGPAEAVMVGRFRLDERLGSGATSIVYAAYDPQLDRRIALKLLPNAAQDEQLAARAAAEAKALARLRHPNVVSVHEIGIHDGDRFIAMELVEGQTLRVWMDEPHPWRQVVDLFIEAGRGLAAAHNAGVIHRDFKPDNVLVEDGHAQVVDFGFARAPVSLLDEDTVEPGRDVAGTPAYMSPEAMRGHVDEAGDQFALCTALYEAVYGARPFSGSTLTELSAAIDSGRPSLPTGRRAIPRWLWRSIVRGLAVDPADRWPRLDELVRHLERKRRRPRAAAMGAGLTGLVLGGVTAASWSPPPVSRCDRAGASVDLVWNAERSVAIGEAFASTALPHAVDGWDRAHKTLDGYAETWARLRLDACLATYVRGEQSDLRFEHQVRCLDHRRAELHALATEFESASAETVTNAVSASRGLGSLSECMETDGGSPLDDGPAPPPTMVARLATAKVSAATGHYDRALPDARSLARDADAGGYLAVASDAYLAVARLEDGKGDYAAAEISAKESIARAERRGDDLLRVKAQLMLSSVLAQQHDGERANEWVTLTRSTLERIGAPERLQARLAFTLGNVRRAQGRFDDAVQASSEALDLQRRVFDEGDPRLANTHYALGAALGRVGRREESREHFQTALELRIEGLGPGHPRVAQAHDGVAQALMDLALMTQARHHFERAIEIGTAAYGPEHVFIARWTINLAICIADQEGPGKSEPYFRRAAEILEVARGPDDIEVGDALLNLARVLLLTDHAQEGLDVLVRVGTIYREQLPPEHSSLVLLHSNLSIAYTRVGDLDGALDSAREAVEVSRHSGGDEHALGLGLLELGRVYRARGEHSRAVVALEESLAVYERVESRPKERAAVHRELAKVYAAAGRPEDEARAQARAKTLIEEHKRLAR